MGQEVAERNGVSRDLYKSISILKIHAKHVYSRDFLLSVAKLEDCKRLPVGLDPVLLRGTHSELVDGGIAIPTASRGLIRGNRESDALSESPPDVPEQRIPSSLPQSSFPQQGPRQQAELNNSSSRPGSMCGGNGPARSNMERSGSAGPGRWEPRLGGADRARERNRPHREWDSTESGGRFHALDSGGRFHAGRLARSGLVVQEHDGLLGSGGPIVQRGMKQTRTHDRHHVPGQTSQTGRTGEQNHPARGGKVQNHPARGGKVSQYLCREDTDSISDETFGSEEWSNEDRSEQERQRRDLFEQMRKEQRKKSKETTRKQNDNWVWDGGQNNETLLSSSPGTPHSSSSKDDTMKAHNRPVVTASTPRLLVPPGFSKAALQKSDSLKENNEASKDQLMNRGDATSLPLQPPVMSKFARWFPSQGASIREIGLTCNNLKPVHQLSKTEDSAIPGSSFPETFELGRGREITVENKFSPVVSLIPAKSQGFVLPMPVGPSLEDVERVMTACADTAIAAVSSEKDLSTDKETCFTLEDHSLSAGHATLSKTPLLTEVLQMRKPSFKDSPQLRVPPVFLTCEDVEQTFLAETAQYTDSESPLSLEEVQQDMAKSINLIQLLQQGSIRQKTERTIQHSQQAVEKDAGNEMDGNASHHIMSLLQKKTGDGTKASHLQDSGSPLSAETSMYPTGHDHRTEDLEKKEIHGNTTEVISLETLFGKVFANELRSVGEPVSSKKLPDDRVNAGKESGFRSLHDAVSPIRTSTRKSGHSDDGFTAEAGKKMWGFDFHHPDALVEGKQSEHSLESDPHNDLWSDLSSHGHAHMNTTNNSATSRGKPMSGSFLSDFGQPKLSPHLSHQGHFIHQPNHEGLYLPTSQIPSHGVPFAPMHEPHFIHNNTPHGMGMYPPNGPFHPLQGGSFLQSGDHVQGQFGDHLGGQSPVERGAYRMSSTFPSEYSESVQMGFDLSHRISGPGIGGSGISPSDRWFAGDPSQTSQGIAGFNAYHHPVPAMVAERNPGYGGSGLGLGLGGFGHHMGSPLDKSINSETTQFPYAPGFEPYVLPDRRLRYG